MINLWYNNCIPSEPDGNRASEQCRDTFYLLQAQTTKKTQKSKYQIASNHRLFQIKKNYVSFIYRHTNPIERL